MFTFYLLGTFIMCVFAVVIVVLIVVHRQSAVKAYLEKQHMLHAHETELLQTTIDVQEETLREIAGEIHDSIGQTLSVSHMQLAGLRSAISTDVGRQRYDSGLLQLRESITSLRRLSHSLHTDFVSRLPLPEAIAGELERLEDATGLKTSLALKIDAEPPAGLTLPVFRMLQEGLHNVVRHADAQKIRVDLRVDASGITLVLEDDGIGFSPDALPSSDSVGLTNMKRRVHALRGALHITAPVDGGTRLAITIPSFL